MSKKDFIDTLYKKRSTFIDPDQAEMLANLLDTVSSDIYSESQRFIFELIQGRTNHCYSFAADNKISLHNSEISWQTKNSYNGSTITVGNADDTDTLTLGIIREGDSRLLKGAIYYFALYNKSLTPEEIETEKERLNEEWLKRKTE